MNLFWECFKESMIFKYYQVLFYSCITEAKKFRRFQSSNTGLKRKKFHLIIIYDFLNLFLTKIF